jgi:hypothetical protein
MARRFFPAILTATLAAALWGSEAQAQQYTNYEAARFPAYREYTINRFWYYPYYYFPANYWPAAGPKWPEPIGKPYMRPPAYMAFPAFLEPHWRYDYWEPHTYHRGFHFLLDIF